MEIILKDGSQLALEAKATAYDAALAISAGLARQVCAALVNDQAVDLRHELKDGDRLELLGFEHKEGQHAFRHSSAHILAQAVKRLYPEAKLAIGPAIDQGFYYDIDCETAMGAEELAAIEAEMKKIVKENLPIVYRSLPRKEALEKLEAEGELYKIELVEGLEDDAVISFYEQGEFSDLCAGPHLMKTGQVKALKLLQVSGAYWRGDEKNKMLQRIYGSSFPDRKALRAHLEALEEAKKRDHNKLGRQLGFFTTVESIGQGLPIMLPKGAKVLQLLQRFVEDEEERRGYELTMTPFMAKNDLYKVSGHWQHYRDGMFTIGAMDEDGEAVGGGEMLAMRPMTCPFQFQAYLTKTRSYRDLPIRYNETAKLFRNEASGEMHGLIRVRQFTLSEGHIFVTPEQTAQEFQGCLELARFMLDSLGLSEDVSYRFSCWDPENKDKYIGSEEGWVQSQTMMEEILKSLDLSYETGLGEAAFYGPKLDIQIKNVFGKEDTLITIQLDFQLAERFGMFYTDREGERQHPLIIHRSSIGCYERTLALLIEKYAGAMPLWIAPEQVRILAISERHVEAAKAAEARLRAEGIRVGTDLRDEKVGKKIAEAQAEKIPYMLILGDREVENDSFSVRHRREGDLGSESTEALIARIKEEAKPGRNDR